MRLTILASAALVALPFLANAQTAVFDDLDIDKDGMLSQAELTAAYPEFQDSDMALIDSDENRMVDTGEYLAAVEGHTLDSVFGMGESRGDDNN